MGPPLHCWKSNLGSGLFVTTVSFLLAALGPNFIWAHPIL